MRFSKKANGFTLVETITVLVVAAIIAAIAIPSLVGYIGSAKEKAAVEECRLVVEAADSLGTEYVLETGVVSYDGDKFNVNTEVTSEAILDLSEAAGEIDEYSYDPDKSEYDQPTYLVNDDKELVTAGAGLFLAVDITDEDYSAAGGVSLTYLKYTASNGVTVWYYNGGYSASGSGEFTEHIHVMQPTAISSELTCTQSEVTLFTCEDSTCSYNYVSVTAEAPGEHDFAADDASAHTCQNTLRAHTVSDGKLVDNTHACAEAESHDWGDTLSDKQAFTSKTCDAVIDGVYTEGALLNGEYEDVCYCKSCGLVKLNTAEPTTAATTAEPTTTTEPTTATEPSSATDSATTEPTTSATEPTTNAEEINVGNWVYGPTNPADTTATAKEVFNSSISDCAFSYALYTSDAYIAVTGKGSNGGVSTQGPSLAYINIGNYSDEEKYIESMEFTFSVTGITNFESLSPSLSGAYASRFEISNVENKSGECLITIRTTDEYTQNAIDYGKKEAAFGSKDSNGSDSENLVLCVSLNGGQYLNPEVMFSLTDESICFVEQYAAEIELTYLGTDLSCIDSITYNADMATLSDSDSDEVSDNGTAWEYSASAVNPISFYLLPDNADDADIGLTVKYKDGTDYSISVNRRDLVCHDTDTHTNGVLTFDIPAMESDSTPIGPTVRFTYTGSDISDASYILATYADGTEVKLSVKADESYLASIINVTAEHGAMDVALYDGDDKVMSEEDVKKSTIQNLVDEQLEKNEAGGGETVYYDVELEPTSVKVKVTVPDGILFDSDNLYVTINDESVTLRTAMDDGVRITPKSKNTVTITDGDGNKLGNKTFKKASVTLGEVYTVEFDSVGGSITIKAEEGSEWLESLSELVDKITLSGGVSVTVDFDLSAFDESSTTIATIGGLSTPTKTISAELVDKSGNVIASGSYSGTLSKLRKSISKGTAEITVSPTQ